MTTDRFTFGLCALLVLLQAAPAAADPPEIVNATAEQAGDSWHFAVTLLHPDTGWDHYADVWQVELEDGTVLGRRVLAHPHETEQPFTRSLGGVDIPAGTSTVLVRAACSLGDETATLFVVALGP